MKKHPPAKLRSRGHDARRATLMDYEWIAVRVAKKELAAEDIVNLELVAADGRDLPDFAAGSHIDVELPGGLIRQYSLCNDATERHRYRIAVLLDPSTRGGSKAVHAQVQPGDTIRISAPRNHFTLFASPQTVLMAGGIGVTPLLCMAHRLSNIGHEFRMHYCTRSASRTAFLHEIKQSRFAEHVHFHFDDGAPAGIGLERDLSQLSKFPIFRFR